MRLSGHGASCATVDLPPVETFHSAEIPPLPLFISVLAGVKVLGPHIS
jgi:hypothetical protein